MRIAMSGSAGTGKTTLARAVADCLQVPYLEEGFRRRRERGLNIQELSKDQHQQLVLELYAEAIDDMTNAMQTHGGFVADRSPIDYLAFWLHYGFWSDADATSALHDKVYADQERLDMVVILPWNAFALIDDGIRSTNVWLQLKYQALLEGLHVRHNVDRPQTLWLAHDITELEQRVSTVRNAYENIP